MPSPWYSPITNAMLENIGAHMPMLSLVFYQCDGITPAGLEAMDAQRKAAKLEDISWYLDTYRSQ